MNAPHKLPPVVESEVDITTEDPLWYNLVYYFLNLKYSRFLYLLCYRYKNLYNCFYQLTNK